MKFIVLSRREIENEDIVRNAIKNKTVIVVSITDVGSKPAKIPNLPNCLGIHREQFHDIDEEVPNYVLYNKEHANRILTFVDSMIPKPELSGIMVHCEAGISRSAGLAAGLSNIVTGSDRTLFKTKPSLNSHVYSTTILEYFNNLKEYRNITSYYYEVCK